MFGTAIPAKSYYLTSMNAVMGDSKMVDTFIFKVTTPLERFIVGLITFGKARKASS